MRRKIIKVLGIGCFILGLAVYARGEVLCSVAKAFQIVLGPGKVVTTVKAFSGANRAAVKKDLGGTLSYRSAVKTPGEINFYYVSKTGVVAVMDTEQGLWGPINFMVGLNPDGSVAKVLVLCYYEQRGKPIAHPGWLQQFVGKTSKDPLKIGNDINGVSGATVSSDAAAFAVKKSILLYDTLYSGK